MGGYNWGADSLMQSVGDALGAQAAESDANRSLRQAQRVKADYDDLAMSNAANVAEKQALRVALAKLDPNHPLLHNAILREKVQEAGRRALAMTDTFEAARDAGASFKY